MRFVRYLLVQVLAYGIDMGGFILLLSRFGVDPLLANVVGKVLAGLFAFMAHRHFTFGIAGQGGQVGQGLRYAALLALNIPLSAVALSVLLWVIPQPVPAKFAADVICVFITYWLSQRYVFVRSDRPGRGNDDEVGP